MADYEYLGILNWNYDPIPGQFWSWGDPMDDFKDYWGSWTWVGYPEGSVDGGMLYEPGPGYDFRWVEIYYWPDRDTNVWIVFHIAETFFETGIEVAVEDLDTGDGMSSQWYPNQLGGGGYPVARYYLGRHRTWNETSYDAALQECTWADSYSGVHNEISSFVLDTSQSCGGSVTPITADLSATSSFRMWLYSNYFVTFTDSENQYRYLASKGGVVVRRNMQWYGYRSVPIYRPTDWNINWFTGWTDADGNTGDNWSDHPREFSSAQVKFQFYAAGVSPSTDSKETTAFIEQIDANTWQNFTSPDTFPIGNDLAAIPVAEGEERIGSFNDHTTWEGAVTTIAFDENDLDDGEHWHITYSESYMRGATPDLREVAPTISSGYATGASLAVRTRFIEVIVRGNWRELHIVPVVPLVLCPPHLRLVQRQDRALGMPGNQPSNPDCDKATRLIGRGEVDQNLTPGKSPRVYLPNSYF